MVTMGSAGHVAIDDLQIVSTSSTALSGEQASALLRYLLSEVDAGLRLIQGR